jgi:hypothetical protein
MPRTRRRTGVGMDLNAWIDFDFRRCHDDFRSLHGTCREEPEHTDQEEQFGKHRLMFLT